MPNPSAVAFLRRALLDPATSSLPGVLHQKHKESFSITIDWEALLADHCKASPNVLEGSLLPLVVIDADPDLFMLRMPVLIHRLRQLRSWLYPLFPTLTSERFDDVEDVSGLRVFHEVRCQVYRVLKVWRVSMVSALKRTFDNLTGSSYSSTTVSKLILSDIKLLDYTPETFPDSSGSIKFNDAEELGTIYRRERFGALQVDCNFFIINHLGVVRQAMLFGDTTPYLKPTDTDEAQAVARLKVWLASKVKRVTRDTSTAGIFKRVPSLKDRQYDPEQYTIAYRTSLAVHVGAGPATSLEGVPLPQPPLAKPRKVYERRELVFNSLVTLWRSSLWVKASTTSVSGVSPREVLMFNQHKKQVTDPRECAEAFFRPVVLMEREPALKTELEQLMLAIPDFKTWRSTFISNMYKAKRRTNKRVFTLHEDTTLLKYAEDLRDSTSAWALLPATHTAEEYRRRLDFLTYARSRFSLTIEQARDLALVEKTLPTSMWIKHRKAARSI